MDVFLKCLNSILDIIRHSLPHERHTYNRYMKFWPFPSSHSDLDQDEPPAEFLGSYLRPTGTSDSDSSNATVDISGVIHSSSDILIHEAGKRLRRRTNARRRFSIATMLNQGTSEAYVVLLHYGSPVVSQSAPLLASDGHNEFTNILIGILSWKDCWAAGVDPTRSDSQIALPGGLLYKFEKAMCRHNPLRGFGT